MTATPAAPAPLTIPRPRALRGRPVRRRDAYRAPGADDGVTRLVDVALLIGDLTLLLSREVDPCRRACLEKLIESARARS